MTSSSPSNLAEVSLPAAMIDAARTRPAVPRLARPAHGPAQYRHWLVYPALAGVAGLLAYALAIYWVGTHPGVDQNGYLVTARLLLEQRTLHFVPENPFQFAGRMMIMTEDGRIFAKYPPGFPLLAAVARLIADAPGMYVVNPLCTVLACVAAFFMFRTVVRDFVALLGVIWLACNPLVLFFANDANSHASTLFCVCLGFWALLSWMRNGTPWKGLLGGFALGYACTIRYSEFLLVLPVTFAAGSTLALVWARQHMTRQRFIGALMPLIGWAIPIAILCLVCWVSFGRPWKTGYTYCREDGGFSWRYLVGDPAANPPKAGNWETFIQQINRTGLFFMWPLSLLGLLAMPRQHWRVASTLALWILPSTLLYLCYYWAPGGEFTVGYMRFFITVVPGLLLLGLWAIDRVVQRLHNAHRAALWVATLGAVVFAGILLFFQAPDAEAGSGGVAWRYAIVGLMALISGAMWLWERQIAGAHFSSALTVGAITLVACGVNLWSITPMLEANHASQQALAETLQQVRATLPPDEDTVLFADETLCNQLDCLGGYRLYSTALFSPSAFASFKHVVDDPERQPGAAEDPNPLQRDRARYYLDLLGRKTALGNWVPKAADEIRHDQLTIIDNALTAHQRVAFLLRSEQGQGPIPLRAGLQIRPLAAWTNTPAVSSQAVMALRWPAWRNKPPKMFSPAARGAWVLYEVVPDLSQRPGETPVR